MSKRLFNSVWGVALQETIVISVPMASFREFMLNHLPSILYHIHLISNKIFLPTGFSPSVTKPDKELMILMRNIETINDRNGPYKLLKTPSAGEIPKLCSRFVLREVNYTKKGFEVEDIKAFLTEDICSSLSANNLRLLGGY